MIALGPLGERAFLARFDSAEEADAWSRSLRAEGWEGVLDVVSAFRTVAVYADPDRLSFDALQERLSAYDPRGVGPLARESFVIPVLYDGADLEPAAARLGMKPTDLVGMHARQEYTVLAIGFLPGFPYAGELPEPLRGLPRRSSPRASVPAGSVAIVGRLTAIYPGASPGGWHLIGRTPLRIVSVAEGRFPLQTGDRLRFLPIPKEDFERRQGDALWN